MPTNPTTDKPVTETKTNNVVSDTPAVKTSDPVVNAADPKGGKISEPIDNALTRVTKKPFGIKVSPTNSPVSPEKFSGYHTGVDFETLQSEQDSDVQIYAVCAGQLALKKYATGYGGVAVQRCKINNSDVTIIYGHLKLASISAKTGQNLNSGELIGILGKGYSTETDGERKHLHLGIHKGTAINILGYVQIKSQLDGWIDAMTLLK
jgi:murein DD-endopeptidase MepM/ murein hydrolase activator NlpD